MSTSAGRFKSAGREHYHYSGWSMDLRESRLKKVEKLILADKPGRLLDVGCSSGEFSSGFIRHGFEVYGTDFSAGKVKGAKGKGVRAVVADFSGKLPFRNGFFDIVFAGEVIEHVVDTDALLQELNRILKQGGKLIITTPNLASFENRIRLLFGIYPAWVNCNVSPPYHIRNYTPPMLKRQLAQNGFKLVRHTGNFVPFLPQMVLDDRKFPFISFTGSLFPGLSQCIIIAAIK